MTNKGNRHLYCVLFLLPVLFLAACSTERNPCLEPTLAKLNVGCYQYNVASKTFVDTSLPNANFVSLDIDSARYWYYGANSLNKFSIVLSPLRDTARWTLQVDSGFSKMDTLSFIYERRLTFYSNACGYGNTYNLIKLISTFNNLDSVQIFNTDVSTKAGIENVKIFF